MRKCPFCAEEIQEEAIKCKHCSEWIEQSSDILETNNTNDNPLNDAQRVSAPHKEISDNNESAILEDERVDFTEEIESNSYYNSKTKVGIGWGWVLLLMLITPSAQKINLYYPAFSLLYSFSLYPVALVSYFKIRKKLLKRRMINDYSTYKDSTFAGIISYVIVLIMLIAFVSIDTFVFSKKFNDIQKTMSFHKSETENLLSNFIYEPATDEAVTYNIELLKKMHEKSKTLESIADRFVPLLKLKCEKESNNCERFDKLSDSYKKLYSTTRDANLALNRYYETDSMKHYNKYVELLENANGLSISINSLFSNND